MGKIWPKFYQFDLYTGHKIRQLNSSILDNLNSKWSIFYCTHIKIFLNFGWFFKDIFWIRLIRGSTYTRVYTVVISTEFDSTYFFQHYISQAFSKTRHFSITLIELSLINILATPSACGSTFRIIMITWLQVSNRVTSMFRYIMMFLPLYLH